MTIEQALAFPCVGETLVGVLHRPTATPQVGVVVVVGGPQYRAGSHRQFVHLARALARGGHAVLRFDARGMGDSSGSARSFEAQHDDIAAAIGQLQHQCPTLRHIVLWGLCDGASAALLYQQQCQDRRVTGLSLLNPWVRSSATLAQTHVKHYYLQRLKQADFWRKLLRGQVAADALRGLWSNLQLARGARGADLSSAQDESYQVRMRKGWQGFAGPVQLLLSGNDFTAREFLLLAASDPAWSVALASPGTMRHDFPDADHTFSSALWRGQVEQCTMTFLNGLAAV